MNYGFSLTEEGLESVGEIAKGDERYGDDSDLKLAPGNDRIPEKGFQNAGEKLDKNTL